GFGSAAEGLGAGSPTEVGNVSWFHTAVLGLVLALCVLGVGLVLRFGWGSYMGIAPQGERRGRRREVEGGFELTDVGMGDGGGEGFVVPGRKGGLGGRGARYNS
ncbi:unnamed protein product, partial [Discosporangium mesarthrocarpum]